MVTRYVDLLDRADANMAVAAARRAHPTARPDPAVAPYLADLATALAHLGHTIGTPTRAAGDLRARLRAADHLATPERIGEPRGPAVDIAEATVALRTAADLIASTGPLPDQLTDRYLAHSEWTHPRPPALHTPAAQAAAWAQIADLALIGADLGAHTGHPELATTAGDWARAALRVPRASHDPSLDGATPGWALPLPRHPVGDEWAGRLEELTAIAWRMTRPAGPGRTHPQLALRHIAEIGYHVHRRAANTPGLDRPGVDALTGRAQVWTRIHACVYALHTPFEPLTPAQRHALNRTRELADLSDLSGEDLLAGRTALAQAAAWAPAALNSLVATPAAGIGPKLPAELRSHPGLALAALQRRTVQIPPGSLDPLAALYATAAGPLHGPTPGPGGPPPGVRLVAHPPTARATPTTVPLVSRGPTTTARR